MKTIRCVSGMLAVLVGLSILAPVTSAAEAKSEDWTDLLEGGLAKHWKTTGNWSFEDGVVRLTPRPGEKGWSRWSDYLWSTRTYGDFKITFEYMVQKGGNSGFYFRVADVNDPVAQGIEVQIYDSASVPESRPLNDHDSGGIIPGVPPTQRAAKPAGEWNKFEITNQADKLTVVLNGKVVNEVDLTKGPLAKRPKMGFIGFQDHALPLALRHIRIRAL
jgi:hypothetical protein